MGIKKYFLGAFLLGLGIYLYIYILPYNFSPQKHFPTNDLTGKFDFYKQQGVWHRQDVLSYFLPDPKYLAQVLGTTDGKNKRIEVDLTNQKLYAFEGDKKVFDFLVSTGKWGRTPTGSFSIWIKLKSTKMSGGNPALGTYYYLPNVPYVMYFYNSEIPRERGYGLHGTYWHSNFGHPMSHGCVNLRTEDAEKLYYWTTPNLSEGKTTVNTTTNNPGTPIIIYGTAPAS